MVSCRCGRAVDILTTGHLLSHPHPIARFTTQLFYNYTGQAGPCFNLSNLMPPGLQGDGWNVQSCVEVSGATGLR